MRDSFCGWYFKCQSEAESLALIPAIHSAAGTKTASLQLIGSTGSRTLILNGAGCRVDHSRPEAMLGRSLFSPEGIRLNLQADGFSAAGELRFGAPTPLRYDIMGLFACVPCMECRHSVWSLRHRVDGVLTINGTPHRFENALGYIEGDRGRSFPQHYLWTQCFFPGGSLMLSAAEIPLAGLRFTGVIGVVWLDGREYRLATYLGAKAVSIGGGEITVKQGDLTLTAVLTEPCSHPLRAPAKGAMARTIREHIACRARYRLQKGADVLLALETDRASFEYEYPGS